jgi:hypothetical protein
MEAASNGHVDCVAALIDSGADVDAHESYGGRTALMLAAAEGYVGMVELLLDKGADIDAASNLKDTALMAAARNGHVDVAVALLDRGADIDATDDDGKTARDRAKTEEIKRLLQVSGVGGGGGGLTCRGRSVGRRCLIMRVAMLTMMVRWNCCYPSEWPTSWRGVVWQGGPPNPLRSALKTG